MPTNALKNRPQRRIVAAILMAACPFPLFAFDFNFPAPATQSFDRQEAFASFALPIGPFINGAMKTSLLEGAVTQTAWSFQAKDMTTLQIFALLRDQLTAAGFEILYQCDTASCGGFDFRFGIDIAAEPAMHVDLGDFRYLAAKGTSADIPDHVAVIVSRTSKLGFVQITQIGKARATVQNVVTPTVEATEKPATTPLGEGLATQGSVALDDLIFASGAADLAAGEYASLDALATYLQANPKTKVALVGHTDGSGGLAGNIALSRARAASVRATMLETYAIPADQITSEGVGYLAPRDGNLTDQGRTRNRRVEVILLVNP